MRGFLQELVGGSKRYTAINYYDGFRMRMNIEKTCSSLRKKCRNDELENIPRCEEYWTTILTLELFSTQQLNKQLSESLQDSQKRSEHSQMGLFSRQILKLNVLAENSCLMFCIENHFIWYGYDWLTRSYSHVSKVEPWAYRCMVLLLQRAMVVLQLMKKDKFLTRSM